MGKNKNIKTNALRILDAHNIPYQQHSYHAPEGFLDGLSVANQLGINPKKIYKTLVLQGTSKEYYVCVIPVDCELDLKKVAKHFHEKKVEMIHSRDITKITGYIKGGCSPVGMKKNFKTALSQEAKALDEITISAGKVGLQMTLSIRDLINIIGAVFGDLTH